MEETIGGTADTGTGGVSRRDGPAGQRGGSPLAAAIQYCDDRHWHVVPGTSLELVDDRERCSCGAADCASPGAHPTGPDWAERATGSAAGARRLWAPAPGASVLLPTGRAFDALDVPETAGYHALARLERQGVALGPVLRTPTQRLVFLVRPGAADAIPVALRASGWSPAALELVAHGAGDYLPAPPTRLGSGGRVLWVRQPTAANRWLPEFTELLGALAYACGRDRAAARHR